MLLPFESGKGIATIVIPLSAAISNGRSSPMKTLVPMKILVLFFLSDIVAMALHIDSVCPIQHAGENHGNQLRTRLYEVEPQCLRTQTSSLAMIARSSGAYHWTTEGRRLADFTSGVLVANLGHNPASWWKKLFSYLDISLGEDTEDSRFHSAAPLTTYNAGTPIEVEASDRLLQSLRSESGGKRMEQVLWAASGSEAAQKALWACMSRRSGSDMILATRGGFHGKKGLAGAVTGSEEDSERDSRVRFISFPKEECGSIERRSRPIDLQPYRDELQQLADEFGDRLCCLITEPYLGGGGSYHPQPEYLQMLEQFCRDQDIAFVLDEIQANFGRTGSMYAFTQYAVEPDIVLLGKGLGNGIPVDAAVGRADLFAGLGYGEASDTWSGHPLGCAAVLATLDEFESGQVVTRSIPLSGVLQEGLQKLCELPVVAAVRGEGTVWGVECANVSKVSASQIAMRAVEACYRGNDTGDAIHLLGPLAGCVIRVAPPLTMAPEEAKHYLQVMYDILSQLSVDERG
ncbi:MAG: aminotransferase class III-fold pyridoxal phosphate-dependent enzyme [Fuerstiella sp.]|nr:aminotransferase class III-fold pyridoxal phosphate-dependent enzyme [Fuerstiella sp.]